MKRMDKGTSCLAARLAGVLLHPTSLPGREGVGDLGSGARAFVDFLAAAGMGLWQVLPLGPTGAANSPYQALSSFAGNPLLVSLEELAGDGLLTAAELERLLAAVAHAEPGRVDYAAARALKQRGLAAAHAALLAGRGGAEFREGFAAFCDRARAWLDGFCLFMALKERFHGRAWYEWPDSGLRTRQDASLARARAELAGRVEFFAFCQYAFHRQWRRLRAYARERGVRLMGDVPIYVAHDSADVWGAPEYFCLDADGRATRVAGVPPDYFSPTGQLWGNPLYRWDRLCADGFTWWIRRVRAVLDLVDLLRIDHFRGLQAYWEVSGGAATAREGRWVQGPGAAFFQALRRELGELPIIAEDLGVITPEVDALRRSFGLPGMKVLQFAFCDGAENYLPHTYKPECVVYTATHDNDTSVGWYRARGPDYAHLDREVIERERDKARRYLGRDGNDIHMDFIRLAMGSVARLAVFPMQDVLGLDNSARMNRPGACEGQWVWRLTGEQLARAPAGLLREMVWLYGREAPRPDGE